MPHLFHVVLAAAEFDDADLVFAAVLDDRRGNERAGDRRRTDADAIARTEQQHLVEIDRCADIAFELLHTQGFPLRHAVLLTACNDNCVHFWISFCSYFANPPEQNRRTRPSPLFREPRIIAIQGFQVKQ